ncbi:MAG: hypothetical protein M1817_003987 [Caeruleum heppii]|nr:MAG: hypothetical protein M1817_003987 [Caeruleum heppii]
MSTSATPSPSGTHVDRELAAQVAMMDDLGASRRANLPLAGDKTMVDLEAMERGKRAHLKGTPEYQLHQKNKHLMDAWKTALVEPEARNTGIDPATGMGSGQSHRVRMLASMAADHQPRGGHMQGRGMAHDHPNKDPKGKGKEVAAGPSNMHQHRAQHLRAQPPLAPRGALQTRGRSLSVGRGAFGGSARSPLNPADGQQRDAKTTSNFPPFRSTTPSRAAARSVSRPAARQIARHSAWQPDTGRLVTDGAAFISAATQALGLAPSKQSPTSPTAVKSSPAPSGAAAAGTAVPHPSEAHSAAPSSSQAASSTNEMKAVSVKQPITEATDLAMKQQPSPLEDQRAMNDRKVSNESHAPATQPSTGLGTTVEVQETEAAVQPADAPTPGTAKVLNSLIEDFDLLGLESPSEQPPESEQGWASELQGIEIKSPEVVHSPVRSSPIPLSPTQQPSNNTPPSTDPMLVDSSNAASEGAQPRNSGLASIHANSTATESHTAQTPSVASQRSKPAVGGSLVQSRWASAEEPRRHRRPSSLATNTWIEPPQPVLSDPTVEQISKFSKSDKMMSGIQAILARGLEERRKKTGGT